MRGREDKIPKSDSSTLRRNFRLAYLLGKSRVYPINPVPNIDLLASVLGEVGNLPFIYLGVPLGAKANSKDIWDRVIEKCEMKLSRWKALYLSMGGRLTLINAMLDALPTYMLTLFPILAIVVQRLEFAPGENSGRYVVSSTLEPSFWKKLK